MYFSTDAVFDGETDKKFSESDVPNPYTNYGIVKFATEKIYRHFSLLHNIDVTILRLSTLYGPFKKTGHIVNLIKSISNNTTTTAYNNGNQIRDLLFVNDAANGIICTINNLQKGFNIFNIFKSYFIFSQIII